MKRELKMKNEKCKVKNGREVVAVRAPSVKISPDCGFSRF
jgi:hypothetical protein